VPHVVLDISLKSFFFLIFEHTTTTVKISAAVITMQVPTGKLKAKDVTTPSDPASPPISAETRVIFLKLQAVNPQAAGI